MIANRAVATVIAAVVWAMVSGCIQGTVVSGHELSFIGEAAFPTSFSYEDTEVGGLSGLDYNPGNGRYVTISDDQAQRGPTRFYELEIDLSDGTLDQGDVVFTGVTEIRDLEKKAFTPGSVDPEAIRIGRYWHWWSSEGNETRAPYVQTMLPDGESVARFTAPDWYAPGEGVGARSNYGFESLTFGHRGKYVIVATENGLRQDGPAASLEQGSPVRVLIMQRSNGRPVAEHIYVTDPIIDPPLRPDGFSTNGVVELLMLDRFRMLAMERSFSAGAGTKVRIYLTTLRDATNVAGLRSIAGRDIRPMPKRLLLDLATLGIPLDNLEGMTLGPRLPDGAESLLLVSDNNFNTSQRTQFLAFRLKR